MGSTVGGVSLGRYTTQSAVPTPEIAEPLRAMVRIHFPRSLVTSVGDAMRHTLMRTGYRLDEAAVSLPGAQEFLALPLPESQRAMGPYTVETILQTLLGPAWVVVQNPVHRSVSFELRAVPN